MTDTRAKNYSFLMQMVIRTTMTRLTLNFLVMMREMIGSFKPMSMQMEVVALDAKWDSISGLIPRSSTISTASSGTVITLCKTLLLALISLEVLISCSFFLFCDMGIKQ